jgi:Ca-activated chloride channel family protein
LSFASPLLLLALLAIPVAALGVRALDRRRRARATAWAAAPLLPNMVPSPPGRRRSLPAALVLLGVALLLVGFARPQAHVHVKTQEATIVFVLDVSGSMAANDYPPNRLVVAKTVVGRFLDKLPKGYRSALVTFSDHAAVAASPTHDTTAVRAALAHAKTGPQGTALADAVVRAVHLGASVRGTAKGKRPPAVIVLLSDGGQTAGRVTPRQAALRARAAHIPVNAILLGTPDGVVQQKLKGGYTERIQVPAQAQTLEAIARGSGGQFTGGPRALDVKGVYDGLGSRTGKKRKAVEVTSAAAAAGLAFLLAGGLLSGVWFRRLP